MLLRLACLTFLWICLPGVVQAQGLPPEVDAAFARARIPREAISVFVAAAEPERATPRLSHRAEVAVNPASVMKLVTTYAALDLLGPAYTWTTPVYLEGNLRDGTLSGNVYIQGQGDPKLVLERLWLLLRRLQGAGVRSIQGDIVLDRSAFDIAPANPADFDGEPLRPYNAAPDALLLNYKSLVITFTPDRKGNTAMVQFDPPLHGVLLPASVPLGGTATECGDYRSALKADFSNAERVRFAGYFPNGCGEKIWPVAYIDPPSYAPRAVQGLWQAMGGQVTGTVRFGPVPAAVAAGGPAFEAVSPPLAEVIRDINKFSNNVMAQQLFLTLGDGNLPSSRSRLQRWWTDRFGKDEPPVLDNGSGLSRQERISAQGLGRMLQHAYLSPSMSELMSSLPIAGVDGTLRRFKNRQAGSAHLKTGSLNNVIARAGYVDAASGKRLVLVAIVNHANANTEASRSAMEALVEWSIKDN